MSYRVREIYPTLQGEGALAGTPAVFVRFAGCNLWSGRHEDRARDVGRSGAACPKWCDTDFVGGDEMGAADIAARARAAVPWRRDDFPLVVLTGGEPLLQLDEALYEALYGAFADIGLSRIAVETNGATPWPEGLLPQDFWVCVSPKVQADRLKIREGDELKVVWPDYNPDAYGEVACGFGHLIVQPRAPADGSEPDPAVERAAAEWCLRNPRWRLSLQSHKHLGLP